MSPTGDSMVYVSGTTHRPIPLAKDLQYRKAHAPVAPKPKGLDWDALRPACTGCGTRSSQLNKLDLCPTCDPVPATSTPADTALSPTTPAPGRRGGRRPAGEGDRRRAHIDVEKVVEMYTAGSSMDEIRDALGHVPRTIRRVLVEAGVEIRPPRRRAKPKTPKPPREPRARAVKPHRDPGVRAVRSDKIVLDTDALVAAYAAGKTLAQLAAEHGCSHPVIARHLDAAGVKRRGAPIHETPEQVAEIRRLYVDEQRTIAEVAAHLGMSSKGVHNIMDRNSIPVRDSASARSALGIGHPIKLTDTDHAEIVDWYLAGTPTADLAAAYGVSQATIYHHLARAGVPRTGRRRPTPGVDRSAGLKQQLAALDVTAREVKEWALRQGLIFEIAVGLPSKRLVAAYADAHTSQEAS